MFKFTPLYLEQLAQFITASSLFVYSMVNYV
jgi:hypothetical protein